MWSSIHADASDAASIAGEEAMFEILAGSKINLRSPSASGRIAMAVYVAVFNRTSDVVSANYYAQWWATDGGDLEGVPDGTPPAV